MNKRYNKLTISLINCSSNSADNYDKYDKKEEEWIKETRSAYPALCFQKRIFSFPYSFTLNVILSDYALDMIGCDLKANHEPYSHGGDRVAAAWGNCLVHEHSEAARDRYTVVMYYA